MIVAIFISLLWINLGFAGTAADQAKGMVDEGAAFMQANGEEKALAEMNKVTQHNAASAQELASAMAIFKTTGPSPEIPGRRPGRDRLGEIRAEPA
jgi:hypothetical protein